MKITVDTSLEDLFNAFIADELWAALNYKNAAFVSKGKALKYSNGVFEDNSDEEFEHMEELIDMAQSLGLKVKVNPKDAEKNCTTPYVDLSTDEDTKALVEIFIKSEQSAIDGYKLALKNKAVLENPELCQFFGEICNDEHAHMKELLDLASNVGAEAPKSEEKDDEDVEDEEKNDEKEDDKDSDDKDDDEKESILTVGSPLTTGKSEDKDEDEKDDKEDKTDKDEDKSEKDDDEDDDEKKDKDSDEDDDDDEDEDEDDDKSVNESVIPYCKKEHSVSKMLSKAFRDVKKNAKQKK